MTKQNEHRAYVTFVGDFDPTDISSRLGIEASRAWKRGELNPLTQMERKSSRWCLDSRLNESASLEKHVNDVLQQIQPHALKISEFAQNFEGVMQLVGYFHSPFPGFGLEKEVVSQLSQYGLGIDCDFYYLYSENREDS
jgi:hypothetical protein